MATAIDQLRMRFNAMNTTQKKTFIVKLQAQLQGKNDPEYMRFLRECIAQYNSEVRGGLVVSNQSYNNVYRNDYYVSTQQRGRNAYYTDLVECPDCGKEVSPRAKSCPSCGCPVSSIVGNPMNISLERDTPSLVLSIIGLVCFWGILSWGGLPCAIIALVRSVKRRYTHNTQASLVMSIIAVGIQVIFFVIAFSEGISYYL